MENTKVNPLEMYKLTIITIERVNIGRAYRQPTARALISSFTYIFFIHYLITPKHINTSGILIWTALTNFWHLYQYPSKSKHHVHSLNLMQIILKTLETSFYLKIYINIMHYNMSRYLKIEPDLYRIYLS